MDDWSGGGLPEEVGDRAGNQKAEEEQSQSDYELDRKCEIDVPLFQFVPLNKCFKPEIGHEGAEPNHQNRDGDQAKGFRPKQSRQNDTEAKLERGFRAVSADIPFCCADASIRERPCGHYLFPQQ